VVGSDEETRNLQIWRGTTPPGKPLDTDITEDFSTMLDTQFAESKARGWTKPAAKEESAETAEVEAAE
jgi:hypothetical protein